MKRLVQGYRPQKDVIAHGLAMEKPLAFSLK
jgi:hypothetical protein